MKQLNKLLGTTLLITGLALASNAKAEGSNDGGWNTPYGALFSLQNFFTQNGWMNGYDGGIGAQMNLGPTGALRLKLDLSRYSNPVSLGESATYFDDGAGNITEVTNKVLIQDGTQTSVFGVGTTSAFNIGLGADYLIRLSTAELAPYVGAGVAFGYGSWASKASDRGVTGADLDGDGTPDPIVDITEVKDSVSGLGLDARGIFGVEWRILKNLSIFAEYNLTVNILQTFSTRSYTGTFDETDPAAIIVDESTDKGTSTTLFGMDTGLEQGGSLGIIAFF